MLPCDYGDSLAQHPLTMHSLTLFLPIAAIGWSILYMLCGGGFFGAAVIFIVLKMFGK
jgi:hypothetical protein